MDHIEVEVKFYIDDPAPLRQLLIMSGARSDGRNFEENIRFDTPAENFKTNQKLIRLRQDKATSLTLKLPHETPAATGCKTYRELEVTISDFQTMRTIMRELGFAECQVYEKWRETFELEETLFCIDELPFGHFIEIEGSPEAIRKWSRELGLNWNKRITTNYLAIFEQLKNEKQISFNQITFDNFKSVPWRFSHIRHAFTPMPD